MSEKIVIIPTYNEIENIECMVETVMQLKPSMHLLVVDDNSPDGTAGVVEKLQSKYTDRLHILNRTEKNGLGTAYIAGFHWCLERDYKYICEMDCDFSHNPKDLNKLIEQCENGSDMSIGSRYVGGVVNVVNWPMSRVLLSYFASVYVRFVTGMPIQDATAGFKCYKRETLAGIDFSKIHFVGYAFQIEMKFIAWRKGLTLKEVPVIFTDRTEGTSKMSSGIIKEAIFGVMKLKIWSWFTKP